MNTYNASTGALITAGLVADHRSIRDLAVFEDKLFVADPMHLGVDEYDALTCALLAKDISVSPGFPNSPVSLAIAAVPEAGFAASALWLYGVNVFTSFRRWAGQERAYRRRGPSLRRLFPERFTPAEISEGVLDFFAHAPMHVATGAALMEMPFEHAEYIADAIKDSKRSTLH